MSSLTTVLLLGLLLGAAPTPWPTKAWLAATPESQGLDPVPLDALSSEFAAGKHGYVDSMLVIRHGRVVYEKTYDHSRAYEKLFVGKGTPGIYNYYDPGWHPYYKRTKLHTMQSVSKSVTSALIGIAIGRKEIPGVDAKMMPYFSAFKIPPDPRRDRMTLRDVLTMTTGIRWDEEDYTAAENSCTVMEGKEDWVQYVLDRPMALEPGRVFVYNSGATQLLSHLIAKTTGKQADDYAREHLFAPLGIDFYWKRTPSGLADTEGGLYLAPRDLAKIGYLYLKDGVWEGKRVLPEGWVRASTASSVATNEEGYGYGYQWWVISRKGPGSYDVYAASGYGGQRLIVVPELELILVFTGWNVYDKPPLDLRFALGRVLGAMKGTP